MAWILTDKGKELVKRNSGKLFIQVIPEGGTYDYSDYQNIEDYDSFLDVLKAEVPFYEDLARESWEEDSPFDEEEAREAWEEEIESTMYVSSIEDEIEKEDECGFLKKFEYAYECDDDEDGMTYSVYRDDECVGRGLSYEEAYFLEYRERSCACRTRIVEED